MSVTSLTLCPLFPHNCVKYVFCAFLCEGTGPNLRSKFESVNTRSRCYNFLFFIKNKHPLLSRARTLVKILIDERDTSHCQMNFLSVHMLCSRHKTSYLQITIKSIFQVNPRARFILFDHVQIECEHQQ